MRSIEHGESWISMLSNRGLGINAKKSLNEGVIVPTRCTEQRHGVREVLREGKLMFLR